MLPPRFGRRPLWVGLHLILLALLCVSRSVAQSDGIFPVQGKTFFEESRYIFVGKLVSKESFWKDGLIFTRHVFQVEEVIKGKPVKRLDLIEYGGTVGATTLAVTHQPSYVPAQQYMVFSYIDLLGHDRTLAGPLGQLPVLTDRNGRRWVRVHSSHPLFDVLGNGPRAVLQEIRTFSQQIRQVLQDSRYATK